MACRRAVLLCAALGLALAACTTAPAPPAAPPAAPVTTGSAATALTLGAEWPTFHGDAARSGAVAAGDERARVHRPVERDPPGDGR